MVCVRVRVCMCVCVYVCVCVHFTVSNVEEAFHIPVQHDSPPPYLELMALSGTQF